MPICREVGRNSFGPFRASKEGVTQLEGISEEAFERLGLHGERLPRSLESFSFAADFNALLEGVAWPQGLRSLVFGHSFNQSLESMSWPSSLEFLRFGHDFQKTLKRVAFPNSLESLSLGHGFNEPLEQISWPNGLQTLSLGHEFNQNLERVSWPSTLGLADLQNTCPFWRDVVDLFSSSSETNAQSLGRLTRNPRTQLLLPLRVQNQWRGPATSSFLLFFRPIISGRRLEKSDLWLGVQPGLERAQLAAPSPKLNLGLVLQPAFRSCSAMQRLAETDRS